MQRVCVYHAATTMRSPFIMRAASVRHGGDRLLHPHRSPRTAIREQAPGYAGAGVRVGGEGDSVTE